MNPTRRFILPALLALSASLGSPLQAEPEKAAPEKAEHKAATEDFTTAVFTLQHAEPEVAKNALKNLELYFDGTIKVDANSRTVVAMGPRAMVNACANILKQLEVSPKSRRSVELNFYILSASKRAVPGGECPEPVREFCEKTKGMFKGFKLLETVVVRTRDGGHSDTAGRFVLDGHEKSESVDYGLYFSELKLTGGSPTRIQIQNLAYRHNRVLSDGKHAGNSLHMTSDVDFVEGQLAAVSTFSQGTAEESLCIIVSAKLLD